MRTNIDIQISKHAKDIIQKYTSGLFKNATLEFYGIKTAKIKELINGELPVVEIKQILEVLKMSKIETVLTRFIIDDRIEIAKKAVKKGYEFRRYS